MPTETRIFGEGDGTSVGEPEDVIAQRKDEIAWCRQVIHGIEHEGWRSQSDHGAGWFDATDIELAHARRRLASAEQQIVVLRGDLVNGYDTAG